MKVQSVRKMNSYNQYILITLDKLILNSSFDTGRIAPIYLCVNMHIYSIEALRYVMLQTQSANSLTWSLFLSNMHQISDQT